MTIITINDKDYNIPTEWNELSAEQLLQVMEILYIKKYDQVQLSMKLLKVLMNIGYSKFFKTNPEDLWEFLYLTNFLIERNTLTKQLIPVYDDFHGPADELGNVAGGELVFANHYHEEWWKNKEDIKTLNLFVSAIYRPAKKDYDFEKNPDGDKRILFNENISAFYAERKICKWPLKVKIAIATWYAGCWHYLQEQNPEVFGGDGEPAEFGLISILRSIAEKGTYGSFEKVEQMPLSLMIIELTETVREGKRREEEMKKIKP